jgi:hypothetical protein
MRLTYLGGDLMKFGIMKGQGATEYLVLLAVVLIIALVSIALLGFFPGLAGDARKTQSDSYWRGEARPFAILEHSGTTGVLNLVIQNVEPEQRTIASITAGSAGATTITAPTGVFAGGEKKSTTTMTTVPAGGFITAPACTAGSTYDLVITIAYSSPDLGSQTEVGVKNLIGKCT